MHTELFIDKGQEDPVPGMPLRDQSQSLRLGQFDLSKNSTMNFKIKVKGEEGPLRIRFEYFDTDS